MAETFDILLDRIASGAARVAVVGAGPGLMVAASDCARAFCATSVFESGPSGLGPAMPTGSDRCSPPVPNGANGFAQPGRIGEADVVVVHSPAPWSDAAGLDLRRLDELSRAIAVEFALGQLVLIDESPYPGATLELVGASLEKRGRRVGVDCWLACSTQQRGRCRIVGGVTQTCRQLATAFVERLGTEVVPAESVTAVEACRFLPDVVAAVSGALYMELTTVLSRAGADPAEAFRLVGGSVGPFDVPAEMRILQWASRRLGVATRIMDAAAARALQHAGDLVERIAEALNEMSRPLRGSKVLLLGAYFGDAARTDGLPIGAELRRRLTEKGAIVSVGGRGRYVSASEGSIRDASHDLTESLVSEQHLVAIMAPVSELDRRWLAEKARAILDLEFGMPIRPPARG